MQVFLFRLHRYTRLQSKTYNPDAFQLDMSGAPCSAVEVFDDGDAKLHAFDLLINEILDHHPPIRSVKVRGKPNPCITEEIRELMKARNVWRKTADRTNDPHAWLPIKTLNTKSGSQSEQARVNSSKIRSKTTHGTQIVFGRQSGSASLKDQSPQKSTAKRTRSWWILSIIFLR